MLRQLLATALVVAVLSPAAAGAAARAASPSGLQAATDAFAAAHPTFPGVAVAVVSPKLTWAGSAGHAALGSQTKLDSLAGFRVASVTKTFVAAATMRLVEQGRLGLDDPIAGLVSPGTKAVLASDGYDLNAITLRHLLTHTSGIYDYASDPAFVQYVLTHGRHHWTRAEQLRFTVQHGKPYAPPGKEFHYSDGGYIVLGEIVERRTGKALAASLRSLLRFGQLGLDHTYLETFEPRPSGALPRAHQYYEQIDSTAFDPSFDLYGGGGLVSTVGDLARFYRALLHGRVFDRSETLKTMLGKPNPRRVADLGSGIFANTFAGEVCWGHSGFWGVTVVHCPASDVTVAMTVNQGNGFDLPSQQLVKKLIQLAR